MSERIIQIIPAEGWQAVYKEDEAHEYIEPVMCFALMEEISPREEPIQYVVPLTFSDGHSWDASDHSNFLRIERVNASERGKKVSTLSISEMAARIKASPRKAKITYSEGGE